MCPCGPDNGEFVYALLAAVAVLVSISLMRAHWTKMGPGLRAGGCLGLLVLVGGPGYVLLRSDGAFPPNSVAVTIETGGLPTLVDLGAGKCVPCKMMAPILDELKVEYEGRMNVRFIDVWEDREEAAPFRVRTIPTQLFYDSSGRELHRHEGFYSKEDILVKWQELGVDLTAASATSPVIATSRTSEPELGDDANEEASASPETDLGEMASSAAAPAEESSLASDLGRRVVAYYFHRALRCYSCLTIEELSKQTIEENFPAELAEGSLEYRSVNIETQEDRHFEDDYKLSVQSLVLVRIEGGQVAEWKNLEKVWDLFEDYGAFAEYVRGEVTKYLYADYSAVGPSATGH